MIRKYRNTDIEELLEVWYASSSLAHPFLDAVFMAQERENIRNSYIPNTDTWIYEEENKILGFIAMMGNEIGAIFVKPEYQGQKIGSRLMDLVAPLHEELEVEVFEKNTIGRAFYHKYGFRFIKEYLHKQSGQKMLRLKLSK